MLESYYKMLNAKDTIKDAMPSIIEAFVEQYGEDKREEIIQKLNSVVIVPYILPDDLKSLLRNIKKEESKIIKRDFLVKNGIAPNDSNMQSFFGKFDMEDYTYHPIYKFYVDIEHIRKDDYDKNSYDYKLLKDRVFNHLKKSYPDINIEEIEELIKKGYLKKEEELVKSYIESLNVYQQRTSVLQQYDKEVEEDKKNNEQLKKKYYLKFINDFIDLIPNNELEKIKTYIEDPNGLIHSTKIPYTSVYLGDSLESSIPLSYFSIEYDNILIDPDESEWRKRSIMQKRIDFFKSIGIDLGNNYNNYINNEECIKSIPSQEIIDKVIQTKNNYLNQFKMEYYSSIGMYKKNHSMLEEENLLDKDTGLKPNLFDKKVTGISPNISRDTMELKPVLFLNLDIDSMEYMDQRLMHELNHVFELFLNEIEGNELEYIYGWEKIRIKLKLASGESNNEVEFKTREKRNVELINEVVNENISQEITSKLHQKGIYIFGDKEISKIKGGTSYELLNHLMINFYDKFKDEIIKSRTNGNYEQLFNELGKDNFDELVILCNDFYRNFGIYRLASVYSALKKNEETEDTILFKQMKAKEMEIIDRMKTFSMGRNL